MKGLKTFPRGGIHPHDRKSYGASAALETLPVQDTLVIPMLQHLGSPSECVVEAGAEIEEGALIGKAGGFVSANIHSPVKGRVREIKDIFLANGIKSRAVVIEGAACDPARFQNSAEWKNLSSQELIGKIASMGVVGMGGATFPVHVKYTLPKGAKAEFLIANGVECEPYLNSDYRLMLEEADGIIEGLRIARQILNPDKVFIGIEANKPEAIRLMKQKAAALDFELEVVPLKLKYPQGDEKQLIKAVTGREVPAGGLPIHIGAVVSNVSTLFAVYEAVCRNKPLMERIVSVSGDAVVKPGNYRVKTGTSYRTLIETCGGIKDTAVKVVSGGPMMGFAVYDLDTPVTKGTSGILVLSSQESRKKTSGPCISCGRCVKACPMGLNPTQLYKAVDHLDYDKALKAGIMDCKECGCCAYSCPAGLALVQGMALGKKMSRKK